MQIKLGFDISKLGDVGVRTDGSCNSFISSANHMLKACHY